jgi:HEAT repeat protein
MDVLRAVLRTASEPEHRVAAAAVIAYAPHKPEVVNDLQYALQDPDEAVRANAVRALNGFAVLAAKQPARGIKVSATWFVEMLNSIVLSDRVESAKALLTLTDRGGPEVLQQIRERSLPALAEMARWKTPRYALPPYLLLGRVAGMMDQDIQQSWRTGHRETVIDQALKPPVRKR